MAYLVSGIQQIGVGIPDFEKAWTWYRCSLGMDVLIFREAGQAPFMKPYTGDQVQSRDAALTMNMRGGGGFEIWQYTSRPTIFPKKPPQIGDTGIFAVQIKTENPWLAYQNFLKKGLVPLTEPKKTPDNKDTFFLSDPWANLIQVVQSSDFFQKKGSVTGGPSGVVMGVRNIEKALVLYRDVLGFDTLLYDVEGCFDDWLALNGGKAKTRRVLLTRSQKPAGPFAPLLGPCRIELVQSLERKAHKIFEGRYWGDGGFIHLCFDVQGMDELGKTLETKGFSFSVDSGGSFDMGEAAGRFTYVEDPDGSLIEFVETYKVPIIKKWGWYLNMNKRSKKKSLPRIFLKALGFNRVRRNCPSI